MDLSQILALAIIVVFVGFFAAVIIQSLFLMKMLAIALIFIALGVLAI